ncbi:MAG: ECF transporter S component [Ktedonobacteraceae bacterium]|nr:ECF transporter S component [Ktedonobacteraceae bacterium]
MSKITPRISTDQPWRLTTERLVLASVFGAITIILGTVPGLGFIPVPNTTGSATTEHIPTIIGGITGGPIVGIFSGLIFGLTSFLRSGVPLFKDPTVSILPRLFIGLIAWAAFASLSRFNRDVAAAVAGLLGSATNTILVLTMIVVRGYAPPAFVLTVIPQSIVEAIGAAILSVALARVFSIIQGRYVRAPETKSREDLPY